MCTTEAQQNKTKVTTRIHLIDFANTEQGPYKELVSICNDLDIGVLGSFPLPLIFA
jgi:hypothetical protein